MSLFISIYFFSAMQPEPVRRTASTGVPRHRPSLVPRRRTRAESRSSRHSVATNQIRKPKRLSLLPEAPPLPMPPPCPSGANPLRPEWPGGTPSPRHRLSSKSVPDDPGRVPGRVSAPSRRDSHDPQVADVNDQRRVRVPGLVPGRVPSREIVTAGSGTRDDHVPGP